VDKLLSLQDSTYAPINIKPHPPGTAMSDIRRGFELEVPSGVGEFDQSFVLNPSISMH